MERNRFAALGDSDSGSAAQRAPSAETVRQRRCLVLVFDPPAKGRGWWHKFIRDEVWPGLCDTHRALIRSQHGPLASIPFIALPTTKATRIDPQPFRILLCRRLHLPLPLTLRTCRCGRVCRGRGFGTPWMSSGGGCSSDLQGGWSSSVHKRVRQRLRPRGLQCPGRQ